MFPVLQVGPLAIQTPGLILILGLWIGLSLSERLALNFETNPLVLNNLVFISLITGIIGAKLAYIVRYFDSFTNAPLSIFSLNPGLLDLRAGIALGVIAALVYTNRKQLPLWSTLDSLTPLFTVLFIAFWLSQFAAGNAYGTETNLPWSIFLWGTLRHPTQLYYTLAGLGILAIIWSQIKIKPNPSGATFLKFIALSSGTILFMEAFRAEGSTLLLNIRLNQFMAWCLLALTLFGLYKRQYSTRQ